MSRPRARVLDVFYADDIAAAADEDADETKRQRIFSIFTSCCLTCMADDCSTTTVYELWKLLSLITVMLHGERTCCSICTVGTKTFAVKGSRAFWYEKLADRDVLCVFENCEASEFVR